MLTKTIELGIIEILPIGTLQVREDTVISEDGKEISRTFTRYILNPGDDITGKPDPIPAITAILWTPSVIIAYKNKLASGALHG